MFRYNVDNDVQLELQAPYQAAAQYQLVEASRDFLAPWMHWTSWVHSEEAMARALAQPLNAMADGKTWGWTIRYRGATAGRIMISRGESGIGELGYWLGEAFTGRGVMTRAAHAIVDWGFGILGLHRIEIKIETDNTPSRAVAERLGAKLDATLREETQRFSGRADLCVYGLLADNWQIISQPRFAQQVTPDIDLRLQQLDDAKMMFRLMRRNAGTFRDLATRNTLHKEREYTKRMLQRYADGKALYMGIWNGKQLIGSMTVHIHPQNCHARIEYALIPQAPPKIAVRTLRTVLAHAFSTLNLNRCWVRVPAAANGHQKVAAAAGMQREATLRKREIFKDTRTDMTVMSILRDEWETNTL